MRNPDVIFVTNQRATEVDGVIDVIRSRNLSIERINLCQYPEHSFISWQPEPRSGASLFTGAKVGWFHDPGRFTIAQSLTGHSRELALRDCDAFWEGAALAASLSWLNPPSSLILSSRKLAQLSRARDLEIRIPPTLVTNDRRAAEIFIKEFSGAVAKSLANGYAVYGEEKLKLYTRFLADPSEDFLTGLAYSPMVFQKKINKRCELRVTIVDERCFGMVAETSDLTETNVDIRRLDYEVERGRFSGFPVPQEIVDASRAIVKSFGLSYAGLDWVQDEEGQWFFLELNCMGAFKWSELRGAGDITTAIADALTRRVLDDSRGN